MGLEPIKRVNITEQVYDQLKSQILSGVWKRGDRLPSENELTQTLQVSRVTVRQALQKLTALGLIETVTGGGSYVTCNPGVLLNTMVPVAYLGSQDIYQVLEFRKVIEIESAGLAAQKATDEDIAGLEANFAQMADCKDNKKEFAMLDLSFHFKLAEMTRNDLIVSTHMILKDVLSVSMEDIVEQLGYNAGLLYHRRLIDAINAHDVQLTKELMSEHVDETGVRLKQRQQG